MFAPYVRPGNELASERLRLRNGGDAMLQTPKLVLNAARWLNFAEEAQLKADATQLPTTRQRLLKRPKPTGS